MLALLDHRPLRPAQSDARRLDRLSPQPERHRVGVLHATGRISTTTGGTIVLVSLLVFIASHAFGQGAVIWVFISEIFPNRVRARGQALGSFTHWVMAAAISWTFPIIAAAVRRARLRLLRGDDVPPAALGPLDHARDEGRAARGDPEEAWDRMSANRPLIAGIGEVLWDILPEGQTAWRRACKLQLLRAGARCGCATHLASGHGRTGRMDPGAPGEAGLRLDGIGRDAEHETGKATVSVDAQGVARFRIHEPSAWDFSRRQPEIIEELRTADAICFGTLGGRSRCHARPSRSW